MKKTLLFTVIGAASLLTLVLDGCSKKGGSGYTMAQLAGTYKLTAATYSAAGLTGDYLQTLDDCKKDDLVALNADSSAIYTDAGIVCVPDGNSVGKWYVSGSLLIRIDNDQKDTATIKSFNGSSLVTVVSGSFSGISGSVTSTLTKQ